MMKKSMISAICIALVFLASSINSYAQEVDSIKVETPQSLASNKTEKNRNEMLNAENNPGPRNVNIGLPFTGDIVILENGLPVVYYFYPTTPTMAWRRDNSLASMGLLSFTETAITTGKVGLAVQSNDRDASSSLRGYASVYGNSHGTSRYDATLTGPLSKKHGLGYMFSFYQTFDRGNGVNFQFTPWNDKATMLKGAIQKKYKSGDIRILYKYVDVKALMANYQPLIYEGDGKTKEYDGFRLGKDSYVLGNGMIPVYNPFTGEPYTANLDDDEHLRSTTHNIYLDGTHRFEGDFLKGWKLDYSAMFQTINSPYSITYPVSLQTFMPDQQGSTEKYYYHGTNTPYEGAVQHVSATIIPQSENKYITGRIELSKKTSNHNMRVGLNYQYNHREFDGYSGAYRQTVEPNPQLLDYYVGGYNMSNTAGGLNVNYTGGYGYSTNDSYRKLALYLSDDIQITNRWNLNTGIRIEHQNKNEKMYDYGWHYDENGRRVHETIDKSRVMDKDFNNDWNYVLAANTVYKITSKFGLLAEATYNTWVDSYWDVPYRDANGNPIPDPATGRCNATIPNTYNINVLNYGGGIYFNLGNQFSVVSKVTKISKENIKYNSASITNKETGEKMDFSPIFYDISTLGWTTEIVASPFKNFNIHFLLTLQKPIYKNFSYSAFDITYNYNDNIIPELSKVLMEIDPSYTFMGGKMRGWVSLRYFGKQYGNPTNAFYYNPRWENFCGLDYTISRNLNLKLQVTNFLDQSGVKGAVQGADQITDADPYVGRIVSASGIRPRTIEVTANVKF